MNNGGRVPASSEGEGRESLSSDEVSPKEAKRRRVDQVVGCPLKGVDVEAVVVHVVAEVKITLTFTNEEGNVIIVEHLLPVDPLGAVTQLRAEYAGRTFKANVKARDDKEMEQFEVPDLDFMCFGEEVKPDIFKIIVGLIQPGERVKVIVSYVTEIVNVPYSSGTMRFYFPSIIAPRYVPAENSVGHTTDAPSLLEEDTVPMSIKVIATLPTRFSVQSPSHSILAEYKGNVPAKPEWHKTIVSLADGRVRMNSDFVLLMMPDEGPRSRLYFENLYDSASTALMAHFTPFIPMEERKAELILVVDCSTSMEGHNIELAKGCIKEILRAVPSDCFYNIIGIGSTHQALFKKTSEQCTPANIKKGLTYAEELRTDLGGTNLKLALEEIYGRTLIPGYSRETIIISDGAVSNDEELTGLIRRNVSNCRIFTAAVGRSPSHHVMQVLAKAGNGNCATLYDFSSLRHEILGLVRNVLLPPVLDPKIEIKTYNNEILRPERALDGHEFQPGIILASPKVAPLFDGCQCLCPFIVRDRHVTEVKVSIETSIGPSSLILQVEQRNNVGTGISKLLHRLAAIRLVRDWEREQVMVLCMSLATQVIDIPRIKNQILATALCNGISSRYSCLATHRTRAFLTASRIDTRQTLDPFTCGPCFIPQSKARNVSIQKGLSGRRNVSSRKRGGLPASPVLPAPPVPAKRKDHAGIRWISASNGTEQMEVDGTQEDPNMALYYDISSLQHADGSFPLNKELADLVVLDLPRLKEELRKNKWTTKSWATVLVVEFIQFKLPTLQDLWKSMVVKAMAYLTSIESGTMKTMRNCALTIFTDSVLRKESH